MERLTTQIADILNEISWKYELFRSKGMNSFKITVKVDNSDPIYVHIDIIDREESFFGYEVLCYKNEKIPSKYIPNGIILANQLNNEDDFVRYLIKDDGLILCITGRGVIEDVNKDDFLFDVNEAIKACEINTAIIKEKAVSSNETDMQYTSSFDIM